MPVPVLSACLPPPNATPRSLAPHPHLRAVPNLLCPFARSSSALPPFLSLTGAGSGAGAGAGSGARVGVGALVSRSRAPVAAPGEEDPVDLGLDSDGDVDPLRDVPKSERQKRKDKLRRAREKESVIDARKRKKEGDFEVGGCSRPVPVARFLLFLLPTLPLLPLLSLLLPMRLHVSPSPFSPPPSPSPPPPSPSPPPFYSCPPPSDGRASLTL